MTAMRKLRASLSAFGELDLRVLAVQKTRMKSRMRTFLFLLSCFAVAFAGCATTRESIGGWFGGAAPTPVAEVTGPSVYYAGTEGMKVYSEPSGSSKVVGQLSRHEKVTRFKLERGYAYVESDGGAKGWVNNAQLIWRLPSSPSTAAPTAAAPEVEEPAEALQEPSPTNTPVPGAPKSQETPAGVAPSIFDAY
jgi:hypothetical protein